jgi:hypothetical protein
MMVMMVPPWFDSLLLTPPTTTFIPQAAYLLMACDRCHAGLLRLPLLPLVMLVLLLELLALLLALTGVPCSFIVACLGATHRSLHGANGKRCCN